MTFFFLCAIVLAAAASARARKTAVRASTVPPILVTRVGPLPRRCSGPRGVALVVARFTQAFNAGDRRRLKRFFDYYFQSYWASEQTNRAWTGVAFSDKATLLRYFARRHAHREKLAPLMIAATTFGPGLPQAASISFWLTRTADDFAKKGINQPLAYGKGIVDCRSKTLVRFGFGLPKKAPVPPPYWPYLEGCPVPAGWDPSQGVIACVSD
jgi:hypothetical protein